MLLTLKRKNKKGFTLIELIVVVAILAILAAVAVPSFIGLTERANEGVLIANASAMAGAINVYNAMDLLPKISSNAAAGVATLKGAGLLPAFDNGDTDATAAIARVTFTNGIAVVNNDFTAHAS